MHRGPHDENRARSRAQRRAIAFSEGSSSAHRYPVPDDYGPVATRRSRRAVVSADRQGEISSRALVRVVKTLADMVGDVQWDHTQRLTVADHIPMVPRGRRKKKVPRTSLIAEAAARKIAEREALEALEKLKRRSAA